MSTQTNVRPLITTPPRLMPEAMAIPTPPRRQRWHFIRHYGMGWLAIIGLLTLILSVTFADQVVPHHPTMDMDLYNGFAPPMWEAGGSSTHILGTDKLGRDILARILHGGRISLRVAFIASTLSTIIGAIYGMVSGYIGGTIDRIMGGITDLWVAFPFLVLAMAVMAVVGTTTTVVIVILTLAGWVYPAKITRAQTLSLRQMDYVTASISIGASPFYIIRQHIMPNILVVNIVLWTFAVGTLILIEGSLSFIGLGVSPPTPSWGNMLSDGRNYLQDAWWLSVFPGLALMFTVLCVNSIGDTLQKLSSHRS